MEGGAFLFWVITKLSGREVYACQFWVCKHDATWILWWGEGHPKKYAELLLWVLKQNPPHTPPNPLQLVRMSQRSRIVQCVVYDDFLSEQQSFQPLGERRRDRELMFSSCYP